jgi:hypothetical protein
MKKLMIWMAAATFSTAVFAQKVEVKNDQITADGTNIALIKRDGCGAMSPNCSFYINSEAGAPLITVVALDMKDPERSNAGNPSGTVRFLRFSFSGMNGVAEVPNPALLATKSKDVAQMIVRAKLIQDGRLDETAVTNFIQAYGTRFSDRQKELNPQQVIIINNGQ